jgi:hypothetical protein
MDIQPTFALKYRRSEIPFTNNSSTINIINNFYNVQNIRSIRVEELGPRAKPVRDTYVDLAGALPQVTLE